MASQVLSGTSNPTYTNNTGQNVRLVLNVLTDVQSMSWAGITTDFINTQPGGTGLVDRSSSTSILPPDFRLVTPYQISLASGESFSAVCGVYNIIVIKEDGT